MKKGLTALCLGALLVVALLAGCAGQKLKDGTYVASEPSYKGEVTLTMTVARGRVSKVQIKGDTKTPNVGQAAMQKLAQSLIDKQSPKINAVSGASFTSKAVMAAAERLFLEAEGKAPAASKPATLADGSYTARTWSFSPNYPLEVKVGVKANRIDSIEVTGGNDTAPILKSAVDLLIPRMIEKQSVRLDAVTGATSSSKAIMAATEDCLRQAIAAAKGEAEGIRNFYLPSAKTTEAKTLETDVLVVGMGGSGIAAAVRAAESLYAKNGKKAEAVRVLGIEKAGKYGGTSAVTSSPMSINPPSFVRKNGGKDFVDAEKLRAAWIEYTEGDAKDWAIDYMMEASGQATDWLMEKGFKFGAPMQGLAQPWLACVAYGGGFGTSKAEVATYFDSIMKHYGEIGGKYMLETSATGLITDKEGAIVGVSAQGADGTKYEIRAKAVVLATGGFAGSSAMTEKYLSTKYYPLKGAAYNVYGMRQNDGAMIEAAIQKGAGTYNIGVPPVSHIGGAVAVMHDYETTPIPGSFDMWTGREMTQSLNDVPMMMAVAPNSLAVNGQGRRFTDETALGSYGNWQAGPRFYTLWSKAMVDEIRTKGLRFDTNGLFVNQGGWPSGKPIPNIEEILGKAEEHGIVVKADSLAALAKKIGMDPKILAKTVSDYNAYCDNQGKPPADGIVKSPVVYDLSGRPLKSGESTFQKVEGKGPYYAVVGSPWIYSTAGGLDVNEGFQVLDKGGKPIAGLYAVGTDSLGVLLTEKKEYVGYGGAAQGWAFTSGYLAGAFVAESLKK